MTAKRLTLSIPDDLAAKLRGVRRDLRQRHRKLNVSEICARALRAEVDRLERLQALARAAAERGAEEAASRVASGGE